MSIRYENKLTQTDSISGASAVFIIFLVELCAGFLYQNQLKEAKLKADYTGQTTIGRVKSQLNHYLAESNLMKHMIEAGYTVNDEEFSVLLADAETTRMSSKHMSLQGRHCHTDLSDAWKRAARTPIRSKILPDGRRPLLPKRAVSTPSQDHLNCSRAASAHCFLT